MERRRRGSGIPARLRDMEAELKREIERRRENRSWDWAFDKAHGPCAMTSVFWPGKGNAVFLLVRPYQDEIDGSFYFEASINRPGAMGMNDHGPGNHPTAKEALDASEKYVRDLFAGRIAARKVKEEKEEWEKAILLAFDGDSGVLEDVTEARLAIITEKLKALNRKERE